MNLSMSRGEESGGGPLAFARVKSRTQRVERIRSFAAQS